MTNMEPLKYKCDDCDKTHNSKSSLKRHINSVNFHRRYVCGNCNKEYVRNIDFLCHRSKCHQPIIMSQNLENINLTNPSKQPRTLDRIVTNNPSVNGPSTSTTNTLEATTALLNGESSIEWTSTKTHPTSVPQNTPTVSTEIVIYNKPEIRITSGETHPNNRRIKKPRPLTTGNEVYEAICSRTPTRPVLATSLRTILLPPPKEGGWNYRTTKF